MNVRKITPLAAVIGLWVGGSSLAAEPAKSSKKPATTDVVAANQQLAEAVAARLTNTTITEGADVSLTTESGVVTVSGVARDAAQKKAILQEVSVVTGVKLVRDGMTVGGVMPVQATVAVGPVAGSPGVGVPPAGFQPGVGGPVVEPTPLGMPGGMGPADGFAPPLPPYAWPTYAPYNNVSRVGYPQAYPYNAFPFIGPYYPFPKVPLGWRTVQLQWDDGHWWLGRKSAPQDYWRVRFW